MTQDAAQEKPEISLADQIVIAKARLDSARALGDQLSIDLAEDALNNLLDRYHTYHTSQRRN